MNKKVNQKKDIEEKVSVPAQTQKRTPRQLKGLVVSNKMQKTVVVAVNKFVMHPKYKKRYNVTKRYKAHDAEQKYQVGDKVIIQESKPFSKEKKWLVVSKY